MRIILIHNEGAGDDDQANAAQLRNLIRDAGHDLIRYCTDNDYWSAGLTKPVDAIAVAGGDGTIGRVAKQLAGNNVPLAVLPMGTANNISHMLGVADIPLEHLIPGWERASIRSIDVGIARGPWGVRRFLEGVGVGAFARTIAEADASGTIASLPDADSRISYALQMVKDRLQKSPPISLSATLDGDELDGNYVLFEALNGQYIGPNLYLAPEGDPGDGYLDVVMVSENERPRLLDYLTSWQKGERRPAALPARRGRHLVMRWTDFPVHIDDVTWPDETVAPSPPAGIDVALEPKALRVLLPAG